MAKSARPRRVRIRLIEEIKTADALDRYQRRAILAATPGARGIETAPHRNFFRDFG